MKLKNGKKYETADGTVYKVRDNKDGWFDVSNKTPHLWFNDGTSHIFPNLIRRHYTKPKPAHKLDLKPGDVVALVAWENFDMSGVGRTFNVGLNGPKTNIWEFNQPKGHRPLFKVVARVSWTKPPS
jgi:hypothetical protein